MGRGWRARGAPSHLPQPPSFPWLSWGKRILPRSQLPLRAAVRPGEPLVSHCQRSGPKAQTVGDQGPGEMGQPQEGAAPPSASFAFSLPHPHLTSANPPGLSFELHPSRMPWGRGRLEALHQTGGWVGGGWQLPLPLAALAPSPFSAPGGCGGGRRPGWGQPRARLLVTKQDSFLSPWQQRPSRLPVPGIALAPSRPPLSGPFPSLLECISQAQGALGPGGLPLPPGLLRSSLGMGHPLVPWSPGQCDIGAHTHARALACIEAAGWGPGRQPPSPCVPPLPFQSHLVQRFARRSHLGGGSGTKQPQ